MKKREIQVLYIITKLELGGAQKVCLSLLKGIQQSGHVGLIISGKEGLLTKEIQKTPNAFLLENFKREVTFYSLFSEVKSFFQLIFYIQKLKKKYPQLIIHTHSTKAGLFGRWAAFFCGIKIKIHTVHGFGFHPYQTNIGWLINFVLEWITSFITTHYICVSSFDVKKGICLIPKFIQKHSIIRAAVNKKEFILSQKLVKNNTNFIFGTIACFKKQKNLFDLFNAFMQCHQQNPHIRLEVIGDGELRPHLEKWIEKHNMSSYITLLGWQHNINFYLQQWHSLVLTSLWEGLPCAVIEARLLKVPVIAYDTGGIHDIIFHGENGLLFKPKNIPAFAQGMLTISLENKLYLKCKNFSDNLSSYDSTTMIQQHIELYKSLCL
ncbi:MAG: glycosyltransferase [Candidatus Babeliales bacterium]